jgi:hypothetical protein
MVLISRGTGGLFRAAKIRKLQLALTAELERVEPRKKQVRRLRAALACEENEGEAVSNALSSATFVKPLRSPPANGPRVAGVKFKSGMKPEKQYAKSVATVSGGLPSLGKRY